MRPIVQSLLGGVAAFAAMSVVTIAAAGQLSDWSEAPDVAPLRPDGAIATPVSTVAEITPTTQTDLTVPLPDGDAAAILVEPQSDATVGVVLVAGAGSADRQALAVLAQRFAAAGVAALTYDKRTEGYSLFHRDYERLADDAVAAVGVMRAATGLDRIGAWGISEGGWVLSAAAARSSSPLAFAVLASAPVVTPLEQSGWIIDRRLGAAPELIRRVGATVVAQGRSQFDYLDFNARPLVASTTMPVMAIWGADDVTVPVNEAYRRMDADLDGGLLAFIVPKAGHDLTAEPAAWLPAAAAWMKAPAGDGLFGVNPTSDLGVAQPVAATWYADPRIHLTVSTLAAGAAAILVWRRSKGRHGRKQS